MYKNVKIVIIMVVIFIALASFSVLALLRQRVPLNPDNAVGNTAGNINNTGYFCENNGKVYFSNSNKNHCLYSMNSDETDVKQLTSLNVKYISSVGDFLYFYMDSSASEQATGLGHFANEYGIYRSHTNGKNMTCMVRDFTKMMQVCGSYVYYQVQQSNNGVLEKIRIDKAKHSIVTKEMINPACYANGMIYYNGVEKDQNLHRINTLQGDSTSVVLNGYFYNPVFHDNYIYYMDVSNNYRLCRFDLTNGSFDVLTNDRIDFFNLNDTYIYYAYSSESNPSLKRMRLDGSDNRVILSGVYNSINLTSKYVYFMRYGDDITTYHMPIDGSSAPVPFNPE